MSSVLDKVRKLIALSASAHEEEARTSAFLAVKLMREHKLVVSEAVRPSTVVSDRSGYAGHHWTDAEDEFRRQRAAEEWLRREADRWAADAQKRREQTEAKTRSEAWTRNAQAEWDAEQARKAKEESKYARYKWPGREYIERDWTRVKDVRYDANYVARCNRQRDYGCHKVGVDEVPRRYAPPEVDYVFEFEVRVVEVMKNYLNRFLDMETIIAMKTELSAVHFGFKENLPKEYRIWVLNHRTRKELLQVCTEETLGQFDFLVWERIISVPNSTRFV